MNQRQIDLMRKEHEYIEQLKTENTRLRGIIERALEEIPDKPKLPIVIDIKEILNEVYAIPS